MHITTIAAFVQSYETSSLFTIVKINDKNKIGSTIRTDVEDKWYQFSSFVKFNDLEEKFPV
jgi:hypothetical protein